MKKSLRDLILELNALDSSIDRALLREGYLVSSAATSDWIPADIRQRVRQALSALPERGGITLREYRVQALGGIRDLAQAWGGKCLSQTYEGFRIPFELECANGHHFQMLMHGLRRGHWCHACFYDHATVYSLTDARAIAAERGGQCLSRRYRNAREKMRWRCSAGHMWSACLDQVLHGDWCRMCHVGSIKPQQAELERAAAGRGGRCLSAYVDKETALEWQCAEGHVWSAPWFRVSKGQWCHRCAVKARTRTIDDLREVAQSRGGRCLSATYLGVHEKHEWECMDKHVWQATANSVWRGSWCPECAKESRRMARNRRKNKGPVPILV
jgi:hypothetical protein